MDPIGANSLMKDSIPIMDFSTIVPFGGQDLLRRGFTSVKSELLPSHPLELSEKNFQINQDKTNFATLRNIQGLHAPLKLQMEFRAVKQVQRLPFLHSSNIALDTLRGNDASIDFEDILNVFTQILSRRGFKDAFFFASSIFKKKKDLVEERYQTNAAEMGERLAQELAAVWAAGDPSQSEAMGEPHMMVEYKLGLL